MTSPKTLKFFNLKQKSANCGPQALFYFKWNAAIERKICGPRPCNIQLFFTLNKFLILDHNKETTYTIFLALRYNTFVQIKDKHNKLILVFNQNTFYRFQK